MLTFILTFMLTFHPFYYFDYLLCFKKFVLTKYLAYNTRYFKKKIVSFIFSKQGAFLSGPLLVLLIYFSLVNRTELKRIEALFVTLA